ncbi:MAG: biotin/lipoyl-binding protein [Planctomycetes bacterium]|nr:biotin/lipoyl-binding protein [Planctomycetota bacterium]
MAWIAFEHEGRRHRFAVARAPGGLWVGWPGGAKFFVPPRPAAVAGGPVHEEVRAPMTAKVVKLATRVGATVKTGDVLVILEAMKMEYRLTAPHDGVVEAVHCAEKDLVDLGKVLVTLEEPE